MKSHFRQKSLCKDEAQIGMQKQLPSRVYKFDFISGVR